MRRLLTSGALVIALLVPVLNFGTGQGGAAVVSSPPAVWTTSTPLPVSRWGLAAATLGGKIYAAGGIGDEGTPTADLWVMNLSTGDWSVLASMPVVRASFYLAASGGYLYAVGGGSTEVDRYDPARNAWTAVASMPFTSRTAAAVGPDGRIYVVDGGTSGFDVAVYDPATDTWTRPAAIAHGYPEAAAPGKDGRIYAFDPMGPVWAYTAAINKWVKVGDGLASPFNQTSFGWGNARVDSRGRFFLIGGSEACGEVCELPNGIVQVFDPATGAWSMAGYTPDTTGAVATVMFGSRLYAVGGDNDGVMATDVLPLGDATPPQVTAGPHVEMDGVSLRGSTVPVVIAWEQVSDPSGVAGSNVQCGVDGGAYAEKGWNQNSYRLAAGHTYACREQWSDGAGNVTGWTAITPFTLTQFQENAGQVAYTGKWARQARKGALGGYVKVSTTVGTSATFRFTGRSVAVMFAGSTRGTDRIYVDGKLAGTYPTTTYGQYTWPKVGTHSVKIVVASLGGGGAGTVLDAFTVLK